MNYSRQRECILEVLHSTKCHPTAAWIYEKVSEQIPSISLGTVYRNLGLLVEAGEIIKIQSAFDQDRFDATAMRHTHMVCNCCGAVVDTSTSEFLEGAIKRESPEGATNFSLVYYGLCPYCEKEKSR